MDGDENLPRATVGAFVKENLDGMKCSNEFIEFILRVSREYISVIADEANKICLQEGKKTIAPYYIYQALKKYNLDSQIEELEQAKQTFSEENHKAQNEIYKNPEMVQQLIRAQEQLFEQSRNKTEPQKQQLNVLLSGEDYKDFADITKKSDFIGLTSTQSKESLNKQSELEDEDDDYQ
ncbi:histone-like transcription factor and archaeal histone protein (macronuclear) [Tetrahymena thermophila SB210]|uniref:Histone-like transcription factor and archaeal histone protein n=1 Tax=Tetrahymena thermophila (strain SB210) TaxID=312017 RepID=I7MKI3_TETTS|nr:histone-like transcription factor and archaeal histone protein [Tetrahymena thermophila SB210]EAR98480.2 histone-like transcription factor and archaeal histone protein [Tetrahymena thermophila SB210]|eukprot:XP_001018725.2 histone-like transcription factor and archaeal histone protein [Tetrahymena thermophila SB210]